MFLTLAKFDTQTTNRYSRRLLESACLEIEDQVKSEGVQAWDQDPEQSTVQMGDPKTSTESIATRERASLGSPEDQDKDLGLEWDQGLLGVGKIQ